MGSWIKAVFNRLSGRTAAKSTGKRQNKPEEQRTDPAKELEIPGEKKNQGDSGRIGENGGASDETERKPDPRHWQDHPGFQNAGMRKMSGKSFSAEKKILRKVVLFDVYRGDKIPEGKKQYAISLTLQDYDKTLTDKYVEQVVGRVLNALSSQFGAVLR